MNKRLALNIPFRASLKTERDFFLSVCRTTDEISGKYSPADYVPKFRDSQNRFLEVPFIKRTSGGKYGNINMVWAFSVSSGN